MNSLQGLENFINEFNQDNDEDFATDSIRVEFSKQHKLERLKELGVWNKINAKDKKIMSKLQQRLTVDEVTTAYQLERENIYYYNSSTPPKYRKATLVIFGMKQYHKEPPKREFITKLISTLDNVSNIDICLDIQHKPNLDELRKYFNLNQYITKNGIFTDTYYINNPEINMIEKIVIYNKALKNSLEGVLWRIEAKVIIPNIRCLALPLYEFKELADLARITNDERTNCTKDKRDTCKRQKF